MSDSIIFMIGSYTFYLPARDNLVSPVGISSLKIFPELIPQ